MLEDDRPSHPMTGVHELTLRGPVETAELRAAVEAARRRHPLLCRIVDASVGPPAWVSPTAGAAEPTGPAVRIDRAPAGTPRTHPRGDWLDIRREVGLRVWVRDEPPDADGTPLCRLSLAIHHCCADALGGLTFLFDLFAHLSAARGGPPPPPPPPPDPDRLRLRDQIYDRPGRLPGLPKGRLNLWAHLLIGLRGLSVRATLPLAPSPGYERRRSGGEGPAPPVDRVSPPRIARFSREETERFRAAAKARGVTMNDLILRDLFVSLRTHNLAVGANDLAPGGEAGFLRVSVPVNLRGRDDLPGSVRRPAAGARGGGARGGGLSVANKIGMALLTRSPKLAEDPEALLDSVHGEMAWVRKTERGRRFVETIRLAQRVVGRTPGRIVGENCYATAVLSNLGDLARVIPPALRDDDDHLCAPAADPGRTLTALDYATASPSRPRTRATLLVATYAGRLRLNLRTDPREIAPAHADALLADLAARVRRTAGAA